MADWSSNHFLSRVSHVYTPRAEATPWPVLRITEKAVDVGLYSECLCLGSQVSDVLPSWGKMQNSSLCCLKNRWKDGRSQRRLQQDLVWVEKEDFCFKLPAAYGKLTRLCCKWDSFLISLSCSSLLVYKTIAVLNADFVSYDFAEFVYSKDFRWNI